MRIFVLVQADGRAVIAFTEQQAHQFRCDANYVGVVRTNEAGEVNQYRTCGVQAVELVGLESLNAALFGEASRMLLDAWTDVPLENWS